MAGRTLVDARQTACVVALSTTLILPSLAGQCLGCCQTSGNRPTDSTAKSSSSCCISGCCDSGHKAPSSQMFAAVSSCDANDDAICCTSADERHLCDCGELPFENSALPTSQPHLSPLDLFAWMPVSAFCDPVPNIHVALALLETRAVLTPSIPPRILYCSWLI